MTRIETIEEIHSIILDLAKEFHRICELHQIPYYMLGGTMLGAIRHKGFIPWDDDMDFGIPREYFEDFKNLCKTELRAPFQLLSLENSDYMYQGFYKISDSRTKVIEEFASKNGELGVNIDIFPLDHTDDSKSLWSFNYRVRALFKFQKLLFVEVNNRPLAQRIVAQICQALYPFSEKKIPSYLDRQITKRSKREWPVFANYFGGWGLKENVRKSVFGTPTEYEFEDTRFWGVSDPDEYLKTLYGDYMKLPPLEKRHVHSTDIFWK